MSSPHDSLFKRVFSNRDDAIGELQSVLPADIIDRLALDDLVVLNASYVDAHLVSRHTDQLYAVPIDGKPGFVYVLFEHQSSSDRWMAFRLLAYMARIWEDFLAEHSAADHLPPIIPLVLHHDDGPWRAATDMHALFPEDLMRGSSLSGLTPQFSFLLDDLVHADDQAIRDRQMSTFARLALWALRDGRSDRLTRTVAAFNDFLEALHDDDGRPMDVRTLLIYIYEVQGHASYEALAKAIPSPRIREVAMTIADQLRQEGIEKGLQQGLQQGQLEGRRDLLRRQLQRKFGELDATVEDRLIHADAEALDRLAERVVTAASLEEIFE